MQIARVFTVEQSLIDHHHRDQRHWHNFRQDRCVVRAGPTGPASIV
jgi:hypothetical protein